MYFLSGPLVQAKGIDNQLNSNLRGVMRKPAWKMQISCAVTLQLISNFFCYIESTVPLLSKSKISSLQPSSLVCVGLCRKPQRKVFSWQGSFPSKLHLTRRSHKSPLRVSSSLIKCKEQILVWVSILSAFFLCNLLTFMDKCCRWRW